MIDSSDRKYIDLLRGFSITRVVLVHLGLSWFYSPYSNYIHAFLPILFFVSGAVSFNSYQKSHNNTKYLLKRLLSIAVPYYLILICAFVFVWFIEKRLPVFYLGELVNWLTFNVSAERDYMPYPMGQIWFLHALFFITLISPFVFSLAKKSEHLLLLPVFLSVSISAIQFNSDITPYFNIFSHTLYSPTSNLSFFVFGAYFYAKRSVFTNNSISFLLISTLFISIFLSSKVNPNDLFDMHVKHPDLFYVAVSFSAIFLLLLFKEPIAFIVKHTLFITPFLLFMNKHSFSIFLLHSLVLNIIHEWIGSASQSLYIASVKIILTFIFTCILAIPFSFITNKIKNKILGRIDFS